VTASPSSGGFYRLCRLLHGYLSAFAFIALIFFSLTGLLLNHPGWLAGEPAETTVHLALPKAEVAGAMAAPHPAEVLAAAVARRTPLIGRFKSGEAQGGEAFIQFQGARGASTVTIDTDSGAAEVVNKPSSLLTMLNDLHRGKNSGAAWRRVIDLTAIVVVALSLLGFVLFFSLRFRLRTSLLITAASLLILAAVFLLLTP
jgi:hypothetical protein